ncbi:MAG: 4-(cytidine 5'-diphospho)-2-C-methyl-D-erythritol kinase [Pseudomonadales bacterium]|nr:4-(cytidine 5'-diphospho)-2-C-methyl-D-erythritol kinase [Pseudomonadales bacterium]
MATVSLRSPAKLNLFLHITGRRPDGYHNLQTLFQFIDLCDIMTFRDTQTDGDIALDLNIPGVATQQNLIYKAARLLKETTQCPLGATIGINKVLPMGGGVGGGSSNAATTLVALNKLWKTELDEDELAKLGLELGADVPVFIRGKAALAEGIGDKLSPVEIDEPWYLLGIPDCHVETATLFKDKCLTRNSNLITIRAASEGQGHNDFEPVARRLFPAVDDALQRLSRFGNAKLTGTGACVFCAFTDQQNALMAKQALDSESCKFPLRTIVTKGLNISPLHQDLAQGD